MRTIQRLDGREGERIEVKCGVTTISFSAHSDYQGTRSLIQDLHPDYVVLGRRIVMMMMIIMTSAWRTRKNEGIKEGFRR